MGKFDNYINVTAPIHSATIKGKLGNANEIFLEGDTKNIESEIKEINSRHENLNKKHDTLSSKHESLSKTVQGIALTGGASTATNVTYNNDNSGLNAENAQDAIDEVSSIGHFAKRGGVVNISTNYNSDHIAEVLTLSQALSKVPSTDRVLGFQGKYLASDGWHTIIYIGNSLTDWGDTTKWTDLADKVFNSISKNATFAGIATPTTNPDTPDGPVFYIANGKGTYTNFGDIDVTEDEVVVLYYDNIWHKNITGIASNDKLTELEKKVSEVDKEFIETNEESIIFKDNNNNEVLHIDENGLDAKNLKSNGKKVITENDISNLPSKEDVDKIQNKVQDIIQENISEYDDDDELIVLNENSNKVVKIGDYGIKSKNYFDLDDKPITQLLYGKSVRIFGGSVSWLFDRYTGGDILRNKGLIVLDDGVSGAGFWTNMAIDNGEIKYTGANIQKQVELATEEGQNVYDYYILWASTNDRNEATYNEKNYTAHDNFDINNRLSQCGGINYCIKKLCEFAPNSKIVIVGSLKAFSGDPSGNYPLQGGKYTSTCELDEVFKAKVDGQEKCAKRFSIPFFSLWENSGFNEYNSDTYFFHSIDDKVYTQYTQYGGYGNDGTHPNALGYEVIANKLYNFIKNI